MGAGIAKSLALGATMVVSGCEAVPTTSVFAYNNIPSRNSNGIITVYTVFNSTNVYRQSFAGGDDERITYFEREALTEQLSILHDLKLHPPRHIVTDTFELRQDFSGDAQNIRNTFSGGIVENIQELSLQQRSFLLGSSAVGVYLSLHPEVTLHRVSREADLNSTVGLIHAAHSSERIAAFLFHTPSTWAPQFARRFNHE